ncbi:MAG: tRNA threonylcarbamoyladenosine dehydratase [Lachnospiraceae bacterium]|nr:tRNA threonylcarbamoyladenosine dehydratase [Lachnospiraceae bacterium]
MPDQFSRTCLMLGKENMQRLQHARVAVFGIGGVGGYVVEGLVRSGIGTFDLIDHDQICLSNLNRQIIATRKTIGKYKVDVAKERILEINPEASVNIYKIFFLPDTADQFDFTQYDYVVDAIDTVSGKLELIQQAMRCNIPVISAMGAGNKMDASALQVGDISETTVCPLARVMRRELKKRGIYHLKVVYSTEKPVEPKEILGEGRDDGDDQENGCQWEDKKENTGRKRPPGSNAFVPSAAGLIIAGEIVKDLTIW